MCVYVCWGGKTFSWGQTGYIRRDGGRERLQERVEEYCRGKSMCRGSDEGRDACMHEWIELGSWLWVMTYHRPVTELGLPSVACYSKCCLVPTASESSGILLEVQIHGGNPRLGDLYFNKFSRWYWCSLFYNIGPSSECEHVAGTQ